MTLFLLCVLHAVLSWPNLAALFVKVWFSLWKCPQLPVTSFSGRMLSSGDPLWRRVKPSPPSRCLSCAVLWMTTELSWIQFCFNICPFRPSEWSVFGWFHSRLTIHLVSIGHWHLAPVYVESCPKQPISAFDSTLRNKAVAIQPFWIPLWLKILVWCQRDGQCITTLCWVRCRLCVCRAVHEGQFLNVFSVHNIPR